MPDTPYLWIWMVFPACVGMNRSIRLCRLRLRCVPRECGDEPFDTVIPIAFKIAAKNPLHAEREVRLACRDAFREQKILRKLIPMIDEVLAAGDIKPPEIPAESVPPAIPPAESIGEVGHRSK